jgi:hypothetical protein
MLESYLEYRLFNESSSSITKILPKGSILFHSTVEKFNLPLRVGGYDKVFWTAEDSGISQMYIPVSSTLYTNTTNITNPSNNKDIQLFQKALGIEYDYSQVEFNGNRAVSYKPAPIFKDIYDEDSDKKAVWYSLKKEVDALYDEYNNSDKHDRELLKKLSDKKIELENLEKQVYGKSIDAKKNELVNKLITDKFGYTPDHTDNYSGNYSWKLKVKFDEGILPANSRSIGTLYILTLKRDFKFYDYAEGREGDLTDLDYHKLDLFRTVEKNGYDGIIINDFAQSELEGNLGHKSFGIFSNAIKDLDVKSISASHPTNEWTEHMWKTRDWRSEEYVKYSNNQTH